MTARLRGPALASLALAATATAAAVYLAGTPGWRAATLLGEIEFYLVALPLAFHLLGPRRGAGLLASVMLAASLTDALKYTLNLPRPPMEAWLAEAEGPGFPSGHASTTASFWGYLAIATGSPIAFIAAVALPGLAGASRIALNVHYPLDVAGGLLLGYSAAAAAHVAQGRLRPETLLAATSAAALVLEWWSAARMEVVFTPLGAAAGILAYRRIVGDKALGLKAGVAGSALAVALGAPGAALDNPLVDAASTFAAALAAVAAPPVAFRLLNRGGREGRGV